MDAGILGVLRHLSEITQAPFAIKLCENTRKTVLALLLAYVLALSLYFSNDRNYRYREEHGSAKWGTPERLNRTYCNKDPYYNKILTQYVVIGLDGRMHRRNLNVVVVGGSGSGKTRFYCKPNLLNASCSYIVLDPKGEMLRDCGEFLSKTHKIKVIDLIHMEKSHCYNPFVYIRCDNDIQRLVTNLFANVTPKGSQS